MTDRYLHGRSCEKEHREGAEYVGLPAIHPSTTWWVRRSMSCDEAETSPGYSMSCDEAVTSPVTQQGLNKNSITRHHVPSIVNAICAGQGPFRGYRCRSQSRQVRVYTAAVVGSSPAGPTHITAGHRPKAAAAQDSWRRPFAKVLSSSADDILAIRDLIERIRERSPKVESHPGPLGCPNICVMGLLRWPR
jgi:hypothetical protein